jgi:hypothetical protein
MRIKLRRTALIPNYLTPWRDSNPQRHSSFPRQVLHELAAGHVRRRGQRAVGGRPGNVRPRRRQVQHPPYPKGAFTR